MPAVKPSINSYRRLEKIWPESFFSGIQRKFNEAPILFSGKKKISGVLKNNDSSLLGLYSDEPRTVPPSPGHNTQLGTSELT